MTWRRERIWLCLPLNFDKVFHSVNYGFLFTELQYYEIAHLTINWEESFFNRRSVQVSVSVIYVKYLADNLYANDFKLIAHRKTGGYPLNILGRLFQTVRGLGVNSKHSQKWTPSRLRYLHPCFIRLSIPDVLMKSFNEKVIQPKVT